MSLTTQAFDVLVKADRIASDADMLETYVRDTAGAPGMADHDLIRAAQRLEEAASTLRRFVERVRQRRADLTNRSAA
jgi:hypothetical protein